MKKGLIIFGLGFCALASAQTRLIVRVNPGANTNAIAATYGVTVLDRTAAAPFALFNVPANRDAELIQTLLNADARVAWAEDDGELEMPEHSSGGKGGTIAAIGGRSVLVSENRNLLTQISHRTNLSEEAGRALKVAVLDTGISPLQAELAAAVVASANLVEPSEAATDVARNSDSDGDGQFDEAVGHGTMVAGLIYQIAPRVGLVNVRVADSDGVSTAWRLVKGLAFAVTQRAAVSNISLGTQTRIPALNDALDWAVEERGLIVVAAAGNDALNSASEPSNNSNVICVAGIDSANRKAGFSNWDSSVGLSAPAVGVKSYYNGGRLGVWSGTSFAAPLVSAGIANGLRLRTVSPTTPRLLRTVRASGDTLLNSVNSSYQGKLGGRLNLRRLAERILAL